jgi:hypothetical protein
MGACTFNRGALGVFGTQLFGGTEDVYKQFRVVRGTLVLSASYATGGDSLALGVVGLREAFALVIDPSRGLHGSGLAINLDITVPSAPKVIAYDAEATEVPNATNLSARTPIPVWILGK